MAKKTGKVPKGMHMMSKTGHMMSDKEMDKMMNPKKMLSKRMPMKKR